jgi:ABC-2 type transport system permease protein
MTGLTGTGTLVRLALRRDRVFLPVAGLSLVTLAAGSASATVGIYPTEASRVKAAEAANATAALRALYGPVYDPTSLGGIAMLKTTAFGALLVALVSMLLVVRHSRAEEESGRLELMSAGVLGRHAPPSAALAVAVGASTVIGAVTAVAVVAAGLPATGSVAFGLTWATAGIAAAAVTGVAVQLAERSRTATGVTVAVLGAAYLLRAAGDSASDGSRTWLSWLSPIGWSQQIRPYGGNRWPVAVLPVLLAVLLVGLAYVLVARRDLGAGLVAARPGPATGAPRLRSPLALAWRLQRSLLAAWAAGFAVLGAVMGSIATDVGGFVDSAESRDLIVKLGGVDGLTDAFLATEFGFLAVIASAYGIQAALRPRSEETELRAEPVLATGVSRARWLGSHVLVALGGSAVLLVVAGTAAGLTNGAQAGDPGAALGRLLGAAVVQVPAVWVLVAIVVALVGRAPRAAATAWGALVVFLLLGELGTLLGLDPAVQGVSPFAHVPRLPGGDYSSAPLLGLLATAALLLTAGFTGFRRRDVG